MTMHCSVSGCQNMATGYGRYCPRHKARKRRHGHPEQLCITKSELRPYLGRVAIRRVINSENPIWSMVETSWSNLVKSADELLQIFVRGRPCRSTEIAASNFILRNTQLVSPASQIDVGLALYLLREDHPHRFRSDDAFRFQLVRSLAALTPQNAGTWFNHTTGKVSRVYRDFPPRTIHIISDLIIPIIGPLGLHLAQLERRDRETASTRQQAFTTALSELQ